MIKGHTLRGCVDWNRTCPRERSNRPSHPAWVCGLKHQNMRLITIINSHTLRGCVDWNIIVIKIIRLRMVTPCVGVWIETDIIDLYGLYCESHPAWVCGLKQGVNMECDGEPGSHPAWVCGLKRRYPFLKERNDEVTPCVGVWIETGKTDESTAEIMRHTLRGCVDWNRCKMIKDTVQNFV